MSGDHIDFLNRQQQSANIARQLENMPQAERASGEDIVREQASAEAQNVAEVAEQTDSGLQTMLDDTRSLRRQIDAGTLDVDDAKRALTDLRSRHGGLTRQTGLLRQRHDRAATTLADPAAAHEALTNKYPTLRG